MCVTLSGFYISQSFAFHAKLGITDDEAANLYKLNPNDPAIKSWKDALEQNIATDQRLCFDTSAPLSEAIKHSCEIVQ